MIIMFCWIGSMIAAVGAIASAGIGVYSAQQSRAAGRQAAAATELQAEANVIYNEKQAQLAESSSEASMEAAAEYQRQAQDEARSAGLIQAAGDQEAMTRSRQAAQDVGDAYAEFAGNGVAIAGSKGDVVDKAVTNVREEAGRDIDTINRNAYLETWSRTENAKSLLASAKASIQDANDALLTAQSYREQSLYGMGTAAYTASAQKLNANASSLSSLGSAVSSLGSAASYGAQAYKDYK